MVTELKSFTSEKRAPPTPLPGMPPLSYFKARAQASLTEHGFSVYRFQPTGESAKEVLSIIKKATKNNWAQDAIEAACDKKALSPSDRAFVLNFALVYWPAFADEPNLRETPAMMISYLIEDPARTLIEKGYFSYFISFMTKDGNPAGFVTGAVINVNRILEACNQAQLNKQLTLTFVGYIALHPKHQRAGADISLLNEIEETVHRTTGRQTDYYLNQVDLPDNTSDPQRQRIASLLLRLWSGRYGLCTVQGLKSMEMIHKFNLGVGVNLFPHPEKQAQLELLFRQVSSGNLSYSDLDALVRALYLYYEVLPSARIRRTGASALEEYVAYSLKDVYKDENGDVRLVPKTTTQRAPKM
jgi:hypothetical protein